MKEAFILLAHFLFHVVIACLLFVVVGAAAAGLWFATLWLEGKGAPHFMVMVLHGMSLFFFAVDVVCTVFFVAAESFKFLRTIWDRLPRREPAK